MAFTGVCFADLLLWFVVGRTFVKNVRLERDCLEHYCERSLKVCNWSSIQVVVVVVFLFFCLFFFDRRSWNSECPELWHALVFD